MAYNKRNRLQRIIDVQELYKLHSKHHQGGCSDRHIYRNLVYPAYRISERTFYAYLATNARKQMKKLEQNEKKQLNLFGQ